MFLNKNYILANELVESMDINIANISMLRTKFEDENDETTLLKMNNCTFIQSNSFKLPNNFKEGISNGSFTDMSNKLPCTWVKEELELTEKQLFNSGVVIDKVVICGKKFYVFSDEFVKTVHKKVVYILNAEETEYCVKHNQIDGYIKASNNRYITWYSLRK